MLYVFSVQVLHAETLAAKEHELSQAVKDYRSQLDDVVMSLAEFKRRALDAEVCLVFWSPFNQAQM
jgi:hypothetical protein